MSVVKIRSREGCSFSSRFCDVAEFETKRALSCRGAPCVGVTLQTSAAGISLVCGLSGALVCLESSFHRRGCIVGQDRGAYYCDDDSSNSRCTGSPMSNVTSGFKMPLIQISEYLVPPFSVYALVSALEHPTLIYQYTGIIFSSNHLRQKL